LCFAQSRNKRTDIPACPCILVNEYLSRKGYDFKRLFTISEYYDRDRPAYYRAIQSVRAGGMDLTKWLEYFAEGLAIQMREVR